LLFPIVRVVPGVANKPTHGIEAMLALILGKVAVHELCLHCRGHLGVPASFDFNDHGEDVTQLWGASACDGVYVNVSYLAGLTDLRLSPPDLNLSVYDDATFREVAPKMLREVVREMLFSLGPPLLVRRFVPEVGHCRSRTVQLLRIAIK
jgi:hypothetical protein